MNQKPRTLEAALHLLADDVILKLGGSNPTLMIMADKCEQALSPYAWSVIDPYQPFQD